jgi:hypothetical protein
MTGRLTKYVDERVGPLTSSIDSRLLNRCAAERAVCWFRTSRTGVSRHAGLMSPEIPD